MNATDDAGLIAAAQASLSQISTALLKAELKARQLEETIRPECGSGKKGAYDTPFHVGAVAIILVLSVLACSFPIAVRRFPSLPVPHRFLFLSRHFGTGVLIATAFVHLLPTAFVSLTDPCLPAFWNTGYPAMPGLIAMIAVLAVVGVEMFFSTRGAGHSHDYGTLDRDSEENGIITAITDSNASRPKYTRKSSSIRRFRNDEGFRLLHGDQDEPVEATGLNHLDANGRTSHKVSLDDDQRGDSDLEFDELDELPDPIKERNGPHSRRSNSITSTYQTPHHTPHPHSDLTNAELLESQKQLLQCLLLEAGILFHSVFIGMAVSVATGTSFVVLLVAISFHQTFEGLALGSRIAAIKAFGPSSLKPWGMAMAYGLTTPAGQLLGLFIHNLYDPQSEMGLLMVGCTNAVSSGLLLYAGLVELLAEDFLSDKSYETLKGWKRVQACGAVVGGGALMALVGAWA